VIRDVYLNFINPKAPEKKVILASRILVLVFGVIAYLVSLAFAQSTTIFERALYAYTIYGSAITPCLVAALFWKRATRAGAIASIILGTVTAIAWAELFKSGRSGRSGTAILAVFSRAESPCHMDFIKNALPGYISGLDAVLPAITVSVAALILVSLLTGKKQVSGR
jgi:Na+/proline symporter